MDDDHNIYNNNLRKFSYENEESEVITNLTTLLDKYKNISKNNALDAEELINLENTELTGESMMIIKIV